MTTTPAPVLVVTSDGHSWIALSRPAGFGLLASAAERAVAHKIKPDGSTWCGARGTVSVLRAGARVPSCLLCQRRRMDAALRRARGPRPTGRSRGDLLLARALRRIRGVR
jgi:hypothetical protein